MYELIRKDGAARRGAAPYCTRGHRDPCVFMNVGTVAAIKGAVSTEDLERIGTQVELFQHLSSPRAARRPGDPRSGRPAQIHVLGQDRSSRTPAGSRCFPWRGSAGSGRRACISTPTLTGRRSSWGRRRACGSSPTWAPLLPWLLTSARPVWADRDYIEKSVARTTRWLARCKAEMDRLNGLPDTINRQQLLFGINQGGHL